MVKIKNKFTKKALAFASAFIILCSVLILPCLAQAPTFPIIDYDTIYSNIYICTLDNSAVLANVIIDYSTPPNSINSINIVYSDYFYNNIYTGNSYNDVDYILGNHFNINIRMTSSNVIIAQQISDILFLDALYELSSGTFYVGNYDTYYIPFENDYNNQFTYWKNAIDSAESNGYDEGLLSGYDQGYEIGLNAGKPIGYQNGYTQALLDYDAFENGLFSIFQAPFVFVQNITTLDVFGISLIDVVVFVIVLCLGFVLIKFIGGAFPI